jgi:hypothetical protein
MLLCTVKKKTKLLKQFHKLRPYPIIMAIESKGGERRAVHRAWERRERYKKFYSGSLTESFVLGVDEVDEGCSKPIIGECGL